MRVIACKAICYVLGKGFAMILQKNPRNLSVHNKWGFPGGKVNPGESYKDAVLRELYEETGIIGERPEKICYFKRVGYEGDELMFIFYVVSVKDATRLQYSHCLTFFKDFSGTMLTSTSEHVVKKYIMLEE